MLDQPFHKGGINISSTGLKDYEFISNSQEDQRVDGLSSHTWNETDEIAVRGGDEIYKDQDSNRNCEADGRLTQNSMEDNIVDKDCEMSHSQKCVLHKGDSNMESDCVFVTKQNKVNAASVQDRQTDVSFMSNSKISNGCIDKLNIDEDFEVPVRLEQEPHSRCSISKDVDFNDVVDVATSDNIEELKTAIGRNVHCEGEKGGNNSLDKKLSFMIPVMDCSQHCIQMNDVHSEGEEVEEDGVIVLYSKRFQNQRVEKYCNFLDDCLHKSIDSDDVKMKANQNDDKKEPLLLLDDCSVDDMSLELPLYSDSLAVENQQKPGVGGEADREVVASSMDSDILPLNDFDSAEDLYPSHSSLYGSSQSMHDRSQSVNDSSKAVLSSAASLNSNNREDVYTPHCSLYDSFQSMHDSCQSMHDSSQSILSSAASTNSDHSMPQRGKTSDIADSGEDLTNTDSGYFSQESHLVENSSQCAISIEPNDGSEKQQQAAVTCSERDLAAGHCNLEFGNVNSTATTTLSSLLLLPGGASPLGSNLQSVDPQLHNREQQQLSHFPTSSDVSAAVAVESETNSSDISDPEKFQASETSTLPSLSQALVTSPSCSYDSHKPLANRRHIKSVLNTFISHKIKPDVCNDDINDITDELAFVLKGSRKRTFFDQDPSIVPIKKFNLVETSSTSNLKDSKKRSETNVGKDGGNCAWSRIKVKHPVQNPDAALVVCSICDASSASARICLCNNGHTICQACLEDQVRMVMASEKVYLSCPEMYCNAAISLDSLSHVLPSLVVDILSDNLRMKAQKATAKAMTSMQELVICPHCACPGMQDELSLQFVCATCNINCCRYCKAPWLRHEGHDGCFLLSYVGKECLKDIVKVPRNWDLKITPFNKNYVQVNIPLDSPEGSTVAAFFAKTSSRRSNVTQVFRIQNRKLWEKYVLKRKHVEEEIGTAELQERFLFHGTKAENIVSICSEGFDIRVPTANGALLGKGIYFSATAKYSERYTDQSHMMYLARVICGWSQQGQKLLTRPQYHTAVRRMYDSCVNDIASPSIFTVFDNSQCYPEYLIQYGL